MRIALVILAMFALACVLLFATLTEAPEGITASQRLQCEQIIQLTRDESALLGEKLDVLKQLVKEDADNAQNQEWKTELAEVQAMLNRSMSAIAELETALASDSPEAIEDAITRLKSK